MMKQLPVPKTEQMNALISGSIYELLKEYIANPQSGDFRKYISVTRADLETYFSQNPQVAEEYLQKHLNQEPTHERQMIEKLGSSYRVYEIDHGKPRFGKKSPPPTKPLPNISFGVMGYTRWLV